MVCSFSRLPASGILCVYTEYSAWLYNTQRAYGKTRQYTYFPAFPIMQNDHIAALQLTNIMLVTAMVTHIVNGNNNTHAIIIFCYILRS